jgi:hypothetical protein
LCQFTWEKHKFPLPIADNIKISDTPQILRIRAMFQAIRGLWCKLPAENNTPFCVLDAYEMHHRGRPSLKRCRESQPLQILLMAPGLINVKQSNYHAWKLVATEAAYEWNNQLTGELLHIWLEKTENARIWESAESSKPLGTDQLCLAVRWQPGTCKRWLFGIARSLYMEQRELLLMLCTRWTFQSADCRSPGWVDTGRNRRSPDWL